MTHILSILFNALGVPLAVAAVCYNSAPAGNAIKFVAGFTVAASILLLLAVSLAGRLVASDSPTWYKRSTIVIDVVITAILAAGGWFWCATAMAVGILVTLVVFACGEKGGAA